MARGALGPMRPIPLLVVVVVALAGCSSKPADQAPVTTTDTITSVAAGGGFEEAVTTTDTLHFRDPPLASGVPLVASEPIRVLVPSDYNTNAQNSGRAPAVWRLPRPMAANGTADVTFWVDVQGLVSNAGALAGAGSDCFWLVIFKMDDGSEGGRNLGGVCLGEPPVVPEGIRQLRAQVPDLDFTGEGRALRLHIATTGIYSTGSTVDVLTGTAEYDSFLTIPGLKAPLDA